MPHNTKEKRKAYRQASVKYGARSNAQRKHDWKRRYGITVEQHEAMAEAQGYMCAICGRHAIETDRAHLCVDHDHKTGKVRGLLCAGCNAHLAVLENADFIIKATAYLELYK